MREQKEKMTQEQAISFDSYSVQNVIKVRTALACGCEPYIDVFTFNRWIAQGYSVKKGEKAIKIGVIKHVEKKDKETGETVDIRMRGTGCVFCRCQVQPIGQREQAAA